jgi:hypothetical protein
MDSIDEYQSSPKKKFKQKCIFQDKWLTEDRYKQWLRKSGVSSALCLFCNSNFTVKHEGIKSINDHLLTQKHKTSIKAKESTNSVKTFFITKNTEEENKVILCELTFIYHNVMHHNSYLSLDCEMKLAAKAFPDSSIAKKLRCGRTKGEMIVKNVLCPASIELCLNELNKSNTKMFSIATDAPNKGNIKLFPIIMKFFSKTFGVKEFIIDLLEDPKEDSESIFNNIQQVLKTNGLCTDKIVSHTADNANVNYGNKKSVFEHLKSVNSNIVKANRNCHVIHNAAKHGCKTLSFDVETLILKISSEFSSSAKNINTLKVNSEFMNIEYKKLLKHTPTRWLTLSNALDRLIEIWPAIKHYFLNQGEDEVAPAIWKFIKDQSSEISSEDDLTFPECYIYFVQSYMNMFAESIRILESNSIQATDLYNIMDNLRSKINTRIADEFFGYKVNLNLEMLNNSEQIKFKTEALKVYERSLKYLEKNFDFENSIFKDLDCLDMKDIDFKRIVSTAKKLKVDINGDNLYEEYCTLRKWLLINKLSSNISLDQQWVKYFENNESPNLLSIIETVFSIPISNAFVERIFSIVKNLWTEERNRMNVNLVKSEVCCRINYNMSCMEFADYASKNVELLKACKSSTKYSLNK